MKKQKTKRLLVLGIVMLALFFAGSNAFADQRQLSGSPVEHRDDDDGVPNCMSGGCGTNACNIGGSVTIWKIGASVQHGVSCGDGYYACCNILNSHCFNSSNCPVVDDIEEVDD